MKTFHFFILTIFFLAAVNSYANTATWKGTTSTSWAVGSNWLSGGTPSNGDDIIIPAGTPYAPGLVANTSCNSLTFSGNNTLSLATYAITINKYFNNSAAAAYITGSDSTQAEITFKATLGGSLSTTTFYNTGTLTITKTIFNFDVNKSEIYNYGGAINFVSAFIQNQYGSTNGTNPVSIYNENNGSATGSITMSATTVYFTDNDCNIYNYGVFTANNGSSLTYTGNSQTGFIYNYGTFYGGTSKSAFTISLGGKSGGITNTGSSTAPANFYLGSTSIIYFPTISGAGASNVITNTANGYSTFTLQSDQYGSASIGSITTGSGNKLTGNFNVERYFQGGTTYSNGRWVERNYRIISSPVNTGTTVNGNYVFGLNYIVGSTAGQTTAASSTTNAFITGCTGGSTSAGNPSVYLYRESLVPNNVTFTSGNFLGVTNITNSTSAGTITASDGNTYSMPVGTGVFFYFRGAATNWSTRTVSPYIAPESVTLTSTGAINQGTYTCKDWYTPASSNLAYTGSGTGSNTNYAVRGFNMTGNPYPSSIDWNTAYASTGITLTNVNPTIWVFNPVTSQYDTYKTTSSSAGTATGSATNIIASGQGFFIQANTSGASVVFNETAKAPASQVTGSNLLMGIPVGQGMVQQLLRLKLSTDSLNYDDIVIGFNQSASLKYNGLEDARYLPGMNAAEGLSSFSADSIQLSINYIPLPKQIQETIRLAVSAQKSGIYTFERTALNAVPAIYEVWLMDNYKKDSLDIRNNTTYAFNVDLTDTATYGSNRFRIIIRQNQALGVHLLNFTATKTTNGAQTVWVTENEANYTNFTVERSIDNGATFIDLGGPSSNGQGTYSFLDKKPPVTADQYRLKITDLNGAITYSNIITLIYGNGKGGPVANTVNVYPNPASSIIDLTVAQNDLGPSGTSYKIIITNSSGSIVRTAVSAGATWQSNVSSFLPGTYVIQVLNRSNNSLVGKAKFIKI